MYCFRPDGNFRLTWDDRHMSVDYPSCKLFVHCYEIPTAMSQHEDSLHILCLAEKMCVNSPNFPCKFMGLNRVPDFFGGEKHHSKWCLDNYASPQKAWGTIAPGDCFLTRKPVPHGFRGNTQPACPACCFWKSSPIQPFQHQSANLVPTQWWLSTHHQPCFNAAFINHRIHGDSAEMDGCGPVYSFFDPAAEQSLVPIHALGQAPVYIYINMYVLLVLVVPSKFHR